MKVEFYKHGLGDEERSALGRLLDSCFLTLGPRTVEFEERFAEYLNVKYCVGTSSFSMGAVITLKAIGIEEGDEVVTTPMTFAATSNAILHAGATPVFVDVEPDTGNIDAAEVERAITARTKAILPVHLYGQMVDMSRLREIASHSGLRILEDAAHCMEGSRGGVRPGELGDAAGFSFYATKNIASGEGGAVVTNDEELYRKLRQYRVQGITKSAVERYAEEYKHWDIEVLGYKANMFDVQAVMLLPQLKRIEEIRDRREAICRRYEEAFSEVDGVEFPRQLPGVKSGRHLFTIWVDPERRDQTLARLEQEGIGVAVNYRAVHLLSYYRRRFGFERGVFPRAERIGDSTITLPLYPRLTDAEVEAVIAAVKKSCRT